MADRIKMRNAETGAVTFLPDTKHWRDAGWSPVAADTPTSVEEQRAALNAARRGDLNDAPAPEVVAAMENLPEDAKAEVIAAEKSGKARKTVISAAEGDQ